MRLAASLTLTAELTPARREAMFGLMRRHYDNVSRSAFHVDLAEKTWVIQLTDRGGGELRGFSTQLVLEADVGGRPVLALFSGDTIVDRDHWGDPALASRWGRLALSLIDADPNAELYWFLLSKGYRTYRFLPLFFREFAPRVGTVMPTRVRDVIDVLARSRYSADYDADAGIVRANASQYRLREGLADITAERLRDPDIRFFCELNPGHKQGDELCCLTPLTRANFTPAAYRVIGDVTAER